MADPGRTEKIISEFLLKSLHAVLAARIPRLLLRHLRPRRRDRWFNLALGDLPPALDLTPAALDPVIIDILLTGPGLAPVVVERWTALCDPASPSPSASLATAYKKSLLLFRSLYSLLRLLPAYKIFRLLSNSTHSYTYDISYRVSSFAEPFSRQEEDGLKPYRVDGVQTQFGELSVSVLYRPSLAEFSFEVSALMPSMIIPDYVGSPAAEPLRMFPVSLPDKGVTPLRVMGFDSPPALTRPHSWANPPMAHRPLSRSPAGPDVRPIYQKFEGFRLSPPWSASPTPSPPTYSGNSPQYSGNSPQYSGNSPQGRVRSETAPVSIPQAVIRSPVLHSRNFSDPTRSQLPPMSSRSSRGVAVDHLSQESPSESRSFRKLEGFRVGDYYSNLHGYTANKGSFKDVRDDSGRFSGILSSGGSPRFGGISRSSSRLSIQDDLDDCDFSYPFAVDDVDTSETPTRKHGSESTPASSSHKSQDAAVGVLVHMLKTAPPLRPDHSFSSQSSRSELGGELGSSSISARKASDALDELQTYKEMKEILLSQSGTKLRDSLNDRRTSFLR